MLTSAFTSGCPTACAVPRPCARGVDVWLLGMPSHIGSVCAGGCVEGVHGRLERSHLCDASVHEDSLMQLDAVTARTITEILASAYLSLQFTDEGITRLRTLWDTLDPKMSLASNVQVYL